MGSFFNGLLFPLHWLAELALVSSHRLFTIFGFDPMAGGTWLASITLLVIVLQLAGLPFAIKGTRALQRFNLVQPKVLELQQKLKGNKDAALIQQTQAEIKRTYKEANTSIWAPLLPGLLQLASFLGLYGALEHAEKTGIGYGPLDRATAASFAHAHLFGVRFDATIGHPGEAALAIPLAIGFILLFALCAYLEQHLVQNLNMTEAMRDRAQGIVARISVFAVPIVILVSSLNIPVSLLYYFAVSGGLTLLQQTMFTYHMPTPTSRAAAARETRLARRTAANT